jgi:hypothetical protein
MTLKMFTQTCTTLKSLFALLCLWNFYDLCAISLLCLLHPVTVHASGHDRNMDILSSAEPTNIN